MLYLIVQILILLLIAALCGGALVYWWMSNRFEDVTESYEELKTKSDDWKVPSNLATKDDLTSIGKRIDGLNLPDVEPVNARLSGIEQSVSAFQVPETDFSPILERLQYLEAQVGRPNPDLETLQARMTGLEETLNYVANAISQIRIDPPDFTPIHQRFDRVEETVQKGQDLAPLHQRFDRVEHAVGAIQIPEVDLGPLHSSLALIELGVDGLEMPNVDFEPLHGHMRELENKLGLLAGQLDNARKGDLELLTSRIASLSSTLSSISVPDIVPLHQQLQTIEHRIGEIKPAAPETQTDFQPVISHLGRIEQQLSTPSGNIETVHERLGAMEITLSELSRALGDLNLPNLQPVEHRLDRLEAIGERQNDARKLEMDEIALRLSSLGERLERSGQVELDTRPFHTMLLGLERAIADSSRGSVDLSGLQGRFNALEAALGDVRLDLQNIGAGQRDTRSVERVERQLVSLESTLGELRKSSGRVQVDLTPVLDAIYRLEGRQQNLAPLMDILSRLEHRQADFEPVLDAIYKKGGSSVDLDPVLSALKRMETRDTDMLAIVDSIRHLESQSVDLEPVLSALRKLDLRMDDLLEKEERVSQLQIDLETLSDEARSVSSAESRQESEQERSSYYTQQYETQSERLNSDDAITTRSISRTTEQRQLDIISSAQREGERANLLIRAAFGPADDLALISGIGPMLSAMLNDIGVFYFWQMAEWSDEDITYVDDRLSHFKGRIQRDDWIGQARELMRQPTAALRP